MFDFGQMPLAPGERWRITAVGGEPIEAGEMWFIRHDGENVTLETACGPMPWRLVWDTDGRAFNLEPLAFANDEPETCTEAVLMELEWVNGALRTTERWDTDGEVVVLNGEQSVRLERADS